MDLNSIIEFDQRATLALNGSDSLFWDNVMYTVTNTFSWSLLIVALLIILYRNNDIRNFLLILISLAILILVADRLCSGIVKPTVARWRPTQDPQIMYMVDVVNGYRGGRYGFFSGHACNTFCVATFLAWLFRYRRITFVLYFWAATTTFTRIYLGVHYLGDITVGLIVGCLLGWIIYNIYSLIHKKLQPSRRFSWQYTVTGYPKSDLNMFLAIVFFNYICVILAAVAQGI